MASFSSPCAACKYLRRKCTQECVFAPYFPPDNLSKFTIVHRVFGASNVSKLLNDLSAADRDDAVRSLVYEAEYRLKDPVYGCVGHISILHQRLKDMQNLLTNAKKELAAYIGPQAMLPILQPPDFMTQRQPSEMIRQQHGPLGMISQPQDPLGMIPQQQDPTGMVPQPQPSAMTRREQQLILIPEEQHMGNPSIPMFPYNNMGDPAMGAPARTSHGSQLIIHEAEQSLRQQQHQKESQQLAAAIAASQQEMMSYEQQQQIRLEFWRVNNDLKFNMGSSSGDGFIDMSNVIGAGTDATISPSLVLGTYDDSPYHRFQLQQLEQPPPPDPYHQFLPQQPEQHHSPDRYHQFLRQQSEHPPPSDTQIHPQHEQRPPSNPYHQLLPQQPEQYPPHQHELQTQLFFGPQKPQQLQQTPQSLQTQQRQLRPEGEEDRSACPS